MVSESGFLSESMPSSDQNRERNVTVGKDVLEIA
jgi:hypothetical protein